MDNSLNYLIQNNSILCLFMISIVFIVYKFYKNCENISKIGKNKRYNLQKRTEECPPFYPNGWLPVMESRDLKKNQVKPLFGFGNDLVAFRGESGKVYVFDAYCPHLGANLGIGGTVIGEEIKCPFHGWKFNNEGNCTEVPGIECLNTPKANIKVWDSHEVNGFIFVWNHSNGEKPNWFMEPIKEIESNQFIYRGRCEHTLLCHMKEYLENNADIMHFQPIHSAPEVLGLPFNRGFLFHLIEKFIYLEFTPLWKTGAKSHLSETETGGKYKIGPLTINANLDDILIGPAVAYLKIYFLGKVRMHGFSLLISEGPMEHRLVHHYYTEPYGLSLITILYSLFWPFVYSSQIERDIVIWNNKKYLKNPRITKNEASIKYFRKWFKQFYSEQQIENN